MLNTYTYTDIEIEDAVIDCGEIKMIISIPGLIAEVEIWNLTAVEYETVKANKENLYKFCESKLPEITREGINWEPKQNNYASRA